MNIKIGFYVTSAIFAIASVISFFVRDTLQLSEYSGSVSSQLIYYAPLTVLLILFVFMMSFFLCLGMLVNKKPVILKKKRKKLIAICSIVLVVAMGIAATGVCFSFFSTVFLERSIALFDYVEDKPIEEIPEEFDFILPFKDDIYYYSLNVISVPQACYVHAQNFTSYEDSMVVYDVEFFEAKTSAIMGQYLFQKTDPILIRGDESRVLRGTEKTIDGVDCIVYAGEDYFQVRVVEEESCFSVVFDNLSSVCEGKNNDFEKLAVDIYKQIKAIDLENINGDGNWIYLL